MSITSPPIDQAFQIIVNVANVPGRVGKVLTDIEDVLIVAKQFKSDPDGSEHYRYLIDDSRIAADIHVSGITTHVVEDTAFDPVDGLREGILYYWSLACKVNGFEKRIEIWTPTRFEFVKDVVRE